MINATIFDARSSLLNINCWQQPRKKFWEY